MNNIMVDLETLDNKPSAIILSIGAVAFDPNTGRLGEEFYQVINTDSCRRAGLTESEDTVAWWKQQSEEAKQVLHEAEAETSCHLLKALIGFKDWLQPFKLSRVKVWGNGSDFDNPILTTAYSKVGMSLPWRFYNNRCYRTLKKLYPTVVFDKREGTYHNALDDAKTQALHAVKIFRVHNALQAKGI